MSLKILVYGWYNQGNLGDELFVDAFQNLFPSFSFTFTDHITTEQLNLVDAVFFGGGSFLGEPLKVSDEAYGLLKIKKVFYIGVGSETDLDPRHKELLSLAQLVAIRTQQNFEKIKQINNNVIVIPDLVYSLPVNVSNDKINKSILIIPNISVVPKWSDSHWKHASWDYFKTEMAQVIDQLLYDKYRVDFLPLCTNEHLNDYYAAGEILAKLTYASNKKLLDKPETFKSAIETISQYQLVISQRYHGAILAELAGVPSIAIQHHDKLKDVSGNHIFYYGISKNALLQRINNIMRNSNEVLPIDRNIFINLKQRVEHALCWSQK